MIPPPGQDSFGNPLPSPASPVQGPGPAGWQAQQGATPVQAAPLPNWTPGAPVQAALLPNWSVNSGIDPTQIAMPLANSTTNSSSGWLGNVVNGAARAVTDPSVTNWLRQQGQYASRAGDYVDLGGKGLGVMGLVTGQPELLAAGAGGEGQGCLSMSWITPPW